MKTTQHHHARLRHTKGFTLLEILLALAIGGMTTFLATESFLMVMDAREKGQARLELSDQARLMLETISQSIRDSDGVIAPPNTVADIALSLHEADTARSPTVFSTQSGILQMTEGAGAPTALSSSPITITDFTVENDAIAGTPGIITVRMSLEYRSLSAEPKILARGNFTTSIALRNHTP